MRMRKSLLPIKGHYFFKNAASALIMPFVSLIAKDLGFSGPVLGFIATTVPILSIVTKPIAGAIADKFRAHKLIYLFFLMTYLGFVLFIKYLPALPTDNGVTLRCHGTTDLVVTTPRSGDRCFIRQLTSLMDNDPLPCQMRCSNKHDMFNKFSDRTWEWDVDNTTEDLKVGISFPLVKENNQIYLKVDYINAKEHSWTEPSCAEPYEWQCHLSCRNIVVHDMITKPSVRGSSLFGYAQFWMFVVIVIVARSSARNLSTLGDTIGFKLLGGDHPNDIGLQMMWGSAAWGLMSVTAGYFVEILSEDRPIKYFFYLFYVSAAFSVMNLIAALYFDLKEDKLTMKSSGIVRDLKQQVFTNPKFLIFLTSVVACGAASALIWNFLIRFIVELVREDDCSDATWVKTLNLFTIGVQCFCGEIPFFLISGRFISKFGHATCMSMVLLGFGLRFMAYYFLTSPWWILPIEILSGITFSTLYSTMLTYANALAPVGTDGTVQGIVSGVFEGVGVTLGTFLGSYFIDSWGVRLLFLNAGMTFTGLAVLHTTVNVVWNERERSSNSYNDRKLPPEQFEVDQSDMNE